MFRLRLVFVMVMIFAFAVAGIPTAAQEGGEGPARVGLRPDAPTYALHGPYWVGTREFAIDIAGRSMRVTAWYPALNPNNDAENVTYKTVMKWEGMPDADYSVHGHALLDAIPDPAGGPYPLVVFSHGYAGIPGLYAYMLEHLASYGFVVLAPDHAELFYADGDPWRDVLQTSINRPRAIVHVLDFAEELTSPDGALDGLIDMEKVAVSGHSYGGYTTLAAAGARYDLKAYNAVCADVGDDPALAGILCGSIVPNEAEMARLAGLDTLPDGLWPSMGDPRVKAILPLAGDAYLFEEAGLAEITIPMLAMGGTLDDSTPYPWGARLAYDYVSSQQKGLVTIESGNHYLFGSQCSDAPWLIDQGLFWFCSDSVWDTSRAHDLINHFATAFLLDVLKGDAEAHAALLPDAVSFPGITYETTMR